MSRVSRVSKIIVIEIYLLRSTSGATVENDECSQHRPLLVTLHSRVYSLQTINGNGSDLLFFKPG